tara:strand:- start:11762 stop:12340 length:579 start_codon:yes stop_codon:yes gene_type:complete
MTEKTNGKSKPGQLGALSAYPDKESIIAKIDEYFDDMPTIHVKGRGGEVILADNSTQSALARYLGYKTRNSMDASLRGREWADVIRYYRDRFIEYHTAAGQVSENHSFHTKILAVYGVSDNPLNKRLHLNLDASKTDVERAQQVLMECANGNIEPSVASSLINAIKATADIKKTSELEDMVNALAEIAGIKN